MTNFERRSTNNLPVGAILQGTSPLGSSFAGPGPHIATVGARMR
jgi:hypothetical protein